MTSEPVWEIPEPLSVCDVRLDEDTVTTLRRHGNPNGPRLVLSHGNGLAIDLYYPFWSRLADEFDLIIYDLRNHGWHAVGARQQHNIPTFIRDLERILEAIDRHYGNKPKIGVFHSVSAVVTLCLSAQNNSCSAQVLFDPPLCKPSYGAVEFDGFADRLAKMTRHLEDRFQTKDRFVQYLHSLPAFAHLTPRTLELMASTTLRRSANGQEYELRCPREYVAQIFEYIRSFTPLVDWEALPCPTKVIGADPALPYAFLPTFDLRHMMTVDYDFIPETTHFLQLEKPEECVAAIREFLEQNGLL